MIYKIQVAVCAASNFQTLHLQHNFMHQLCACHNQNQTPQPSLSTASTGTLAAPPALVATSVWCFAAATATTVRLPKPATKRGKIWQHRRQQHQTQA